MTVEFQTLRSLEIQRLSLATVSALGESKCSVVLAREEVLDLLKICRIGQVELFFRETGQVGRIDRQRKDLRAGIMLEVGAAHDEMRVGKRLTFSFELFREFYFFESSVSTVGGGTNTISLPDRIFRVHRRILDRCYLPDERKFEVNVRELTGKRCFHGIVVDLSSKGLGIRVPLTDRLPVERLVSGGIDIVVEARIPTIRKAEPVPAKIIRWEKENGGVLLGVACAVPLALGYEQTLEDFVLERKYPNVFRARTDEDFQDVWRLLNLSFGTIDAVPDEHRQRESILTWKKAAWSRVGINRLYLLQQQARERERPERVGTIAVSRFYSRTWLIHQLAVDGTKGQVLSHQLYGRVIDYLRDTDGVRYTIGTFPKNSHVFQQYYIGFIKADPRSDFHYLEDTNIVEFDVQSAIRDLDRVGVCPSVTIAPMDVSSGQVVIRNLKELFPPIFLDALDIKDFDMGLQEVEAIYSATALRRSRKWFVAKAEGRVVGAGFAEWGSESQNVFSLFDNFRIFLFRENEPVSREIKIGLLKAVFRAYAQNGVNLAITWSRDPDMVSYCPSGKVFYEAYLWLANAERMKAFMRHLDRLHGRVGVIRSMRRS